LPEVLAQCTPGRELADRGLAEDLAAASVLDISTAVPVLRDGVFRV
jgi:2-phosphosulfolactate phosphatase